MKKKLVSIFIILVLLLGSGALMFGSQEKSYEEIKLYSGEINGKRFLEYLMSANLTKYSGSPRRDFHISLMEDYNVMNIDIIIYGDGTADITVNRQTETGLGGYEDRSSSGAVADKAWFYTDGFDIEFFYRIK